ncbi:hypothetical protein QUF70_20325, partial [Desulfobacterales bacterium HSG17]|nr:hypothetical protein [Desulfobacterales bacterium HSG17]
YDPFGSIPVCKDWEPYLLAKEEHMRKLRNMSDCAEFYISKSGLCVGFVETKLIMGGKGFLYTHDCDAVILHNPAFGFPPESKYTIVTKEIPLDNLKKFFDIKEKGWGGRDTIMGSPRKGTELNKKQVLKIVLNRV